MAEYGWAYIVGGGPAGISGSVQTKGSDTQLSGSRQLVYTEETGLGTLDLSGTLNVSGAINANELNINIVNREVINLSATGSTKFGDTIDDTHTFTGSILLSGATNPLQIQGLKTGTGVSSGHYLGVDSNNNIVLTSSDGGPGGGGLIDEYTNPGDNRVITSIDASGINAEANMLFDGSTLTVTGDITSSVGISSSVGQFTHLTGSRITDGTVLITGGNLTNATAVNAVSLGGALTTAAQAAVTSVGTLTSLNVSGDVSASALFVSASNERVGIGTNSPEKKLEVYDKNDQLRLTYSKYIPFLESNVHTDFKTNAAGYLLLSPSGQRVGIGTATPTKMLDVEGNMRVGGNLEITGTLSAKVTDFVVSANNIIFGDDATDTLTFNAATASVPNGLNFSSNLLSLANSKVGIGVQYADTKLEVLDTTAQLKLAYNQSNAAVFTVDSVGSLEINPNGALTASADFRSNGNVTLGRNCNDTVETLGQLTASCGISASVYIGEQVQAANGIFTQQVQVGTSTVYITPTAITGTSLITSDAYAGTLNTAAQPNITSVGNLTGLIVDTNVLVVDAATDRVGIGIADARKPLEVLHASAKQLRLSQQKAAGLDPDVYTDFQTNASGYLLIDPSGARVGIGTSNPTKMLDVQGNMRVGGNLEITGTLSAKVTDFIVSANNIIFGDDATDSLTFNAATASIPNDLNFASGLLSLDNANSKIGIGVQYPDTKLQIKTTGDQLKLSYDDSAAARFTVSSTGDLTIKPSGNYLTASSGLNISGSSFLGTLTSQHTVVSGELTASVAVSSSVGRFTQLTASNLTDGTAIITGGNISGVGTLTATSVAGTLTTAAQPNVTSLGTLTSLAVTGDLTVDTTTFKVDSSTNRVGIGVTDPQMPLEISSSVGGLRLTYSRAVFGGPSLVRSDLSTDSSGKLVLESSGNKTKVVGGLEITGLAAGTGLTTKYLALDAGNNIILTSSVAPGIETRNRRVVTGNTTLSDDDYYLGIAASGDVLITLLGAEDLSDGQTFTFKDEGGTADSHTFEIRASGSQLIDGETSIFLESPYGSLNLYTNGINKYFIF